MKMENLKVQFQVLLVSERCQMNSVWSEDFNVSSPDGETGLSCRTQMFNILMYLHHKYIFSFVPEAVF